MTSVLDIFSPVIGQYMWSAYRTHGSCMFMEFGQPHLYVREPVVASAIAALRDRRMVKPKGAWSLLIEYCDYDITSGGLRMTEVETDRDLISACLMHLEGQRLASVQEGAGSFSLELGFDLGGRVALRPTRDPHFRVGDSQWLLTLPGGRTAAYSNGGTLSVA